MAHISIAGNLTADPELRYTPSGQPVVNFTIVENRRKRTQDGGYEDLEPNFFRVEAWGVLAEHAAASLKKGARATVDGTISTSSWEDKETKAKRSAQRVVASDIGYSLRWEVVTVTTSDAPESVSVDSWPVAEIPSDEDTPF